MSEMNQCKATITGNDGKIYYCVRDEDHNRHEVDQQYGGEAVPYWPIEYYTTLQRDYDRIKQERDVEDTWRKRWQEAYLEEQTKRIALQQENERLKADRYCDCGKIRTIGACTGHCDNDE